MRKSTLQKLGDTLSWAKVQLRKLPHLFGKEIWQTQNLAVRGLKGRLFAILRFAAITYNGILRHRVPSQAAALSYYTLIAIGPMLAIAIMISGFVLHEEGEDLAVKSLTRLVYFIAPPAEAVGGDLDDFFGPIDSQRTTTLRAAQVDSEADDPAASPDPHLVRIITDLVQNARSGTVGVVGSIILVFISIQLLAHIEKTFNTIWGVRRGRNWVERTVFYWSLISLGAVFGFTAVTLGIYNRVAALAGHLPFGHIFQEGIMLMAPLVAFMLVALMLAIFNRFIPNTHVRWGPALVGAMLVTALLYLNQALSFFYIGFVIRQQSLFGVVGIIPVLLFGLFVFWLFLLLGGQVTYALQNLNSLSNQRAWDNVSPRTREILCVATLLNIARRFQDCQPAATATEIAEQLRVPGNIINETLSRLDDLGYVSPVKHASGSKYAPLAYQMAKPLEKICLGRFKQAMECTGNNAGLELLEDMDPALKFYHDKLLDPVATGDAARNLAQLLDIGPAAKPAQDNCRPQC